MPPPPQPIRPIDRASEYLQEFRNVLWPNVKLLIKNLPWGECFPFVPIGPLTTGRRHPVNSTDRAWMMTTRLAKLGWKASMRR
ncbi:hypothetical protein IAR50_005351 [Cryptococcus sp. DSM 104548]